MGILEKTYKAVESKLDSIIKSNEAGIQHQNNKRKGLVELESSNSDGGIYREKYSNAGPGTLKSMARKDSMIVAIHQCLVNQVSNFTQPQRDRYSPGFVFKPTDPADLTREEKLSLADPDLEEEDLKKLKFDLDKKKMERQKKQEEEIKALSSFLMHCGSEKSDTDTTYRRIDFDKLVKILVRDRLTYNYSAIELIPTKGGEKIHNFYPVSAGTIRYVSSKSADHYKKTVKPALAENLGERYKNDGENEGKPYRYVQVLRGKPVAAFTEDELIYEAANPSVDPEDYGYAQGELEWLINVVTSHLYAEAHNRNFFTQGVGNKGILHIKGDNISRSQLEGFKRQWFNQLSNTRNAFRPPVIGMADEVKWIALTQSNREMEFQQWMEYLIKIACAIYQIDPSEINFDISKSNTSTLNESNNENKIKSSRNKGLRPLLMFVQNIVNHQILPRWNKELSEKYDFEFVGLESETKMQEVDRFQKESQIYKTVNEIRTEMGKAPIDHGDIILSAAYTQYIAQQEVKDQELENPEMGEEGDLEGGEDQDFSDIESEIDEALSELEEPDTKDTKDVKKSEAAKIEYYSFDSEDED